MKLFNLKKVAAAAVFSIATVAFNGAIVNVAQASPYCVNGTFGSSNVTDNTGPGGSACSTVTNGESDSTGAFSILKTQIGNAFNVANTNVTLNVNGGTIAATGSSGTAVNIGAGYGLTTLTNTGIITANGSGGAISLNGTGSSIGTLTNTATGSIGTGLISSTTYNAMTGISASSGATITTIDNSGTIFGSSSGGTAINNGGSIVTITNETNATITAGSQAISNSGSIGTIANLSNASIGNSTTTPTTAISNTSGGSITTITNSGSIYGSYYGIQNNQNATIGTLTNGGTISAVATPTSYGIYNVGTINSLTNTGTISGSTYGIYNTASSPSVFGTIGLLDNTLGTITGGIRNSGTITNLINGSSTLTFNGKLPTNYNVVVNSPTSYGKLAVTNPASSTTAFGIAAGSTVVNGSTYAAVISGIASSSSFSTSSGTYTGGLAWHLSEEGTSGVWDLVMTAGSTPIPSSGPNAANTLSSVQQNASGLSALYNQQAAAYQAALSYDCQVYDENNMCVSVGGRYTYAGPSPSANAQSGLVVLGYRPMGTLRVGAFADQSVNVTTPDGFKQNNNSPMWGLYAKWNLNQSGNGLGVQASAVSSASSLNVTRAQLTNTEAGSGTTQFNGQGYQLTTNYHQPVTDSTALVPYLGLRYTRINAGAYTENATATVTSPLSYNAMAQNTFSAIGGIGIKSLLAEKLTGTASVGIQQILNYSMGNYQGISSISGLNSFSVQMPGSNNSMATATAGLYYDIGKAERVGVNVLWQQQPFIATNTTTALATYTIGF